MFTTTRLEPSTTIFFVFGTHLPHENTGQSVGMADNDQPSRFDNPVLVGLRVYKVSRLYGLGLFDFLGSPAPNEDGLSLPRKS
jgi:hypothetical protein